MTMDRSIFRAPLALRTLVAIAALALTSLASAGDLSGRWAGMWEDNGSGHAGPLKAKITRNCDGSYHCCFHGRFMKIIPFCYKTDLEVVCEDGCSTQMQGTSRIPIFGDFHYNAVATDCEFVLKFCSKRYSGTFTMDRRSVFCCGE